MKRRWVKALLALLIFAVALWLSFLGSGVRDKSKVERYRDQLRAAGEKLDYRELSPTDVPPEQNLAGLVRQAISNPSLNLHDAVYTNQPLAMHLVVPGRAAVGWREPMIRGYDNATNDWEDLRVGLQARANVLEVLHQLPVGARVDFNLDFSRGANLLLPHLAKMKALVQVLSVAANFELHQNDVASAATNIQSALILTESYSSEPLLISQLVRIAMAQIALTAQWEWLQATNITETQAATLQNSWANLKFIQPMEKALMMERAYMAITIANLRTSNSPSAGFYGSSPFGPPSGGGSGDWLDGLKELGQSMKRGAADQLWKSSWSYLDELQMMQADQVLIEAARQMQTNGFCIYALTNCEYQLRIRGLNRANVSWLRSKLGDNLVSWAAGEPPKVLNIVINAEVARQLAITALALKRYELRHGNYPPDLKSLVPDFLAAVPPDPVDGRPLRYRLNPDGMFLLYSIGDDGKDDGGNSAPTTTTSRSFNLFRAHDWVWPQPATESEVQFYRETESSHR